MFATDMGGDKDEELDSAVGDMSGEVLILMWILFGVPGVVVEMDVGKKCPRAAAGEDMSRGSRSTSHFRLKRREREREDSNLI